MTSGRQWKIVEFAKLLPMHLNPLEMSVNFHHMCGIPLELICSTEQNGLPCGGDYFSKFLILRKIPNTSIHMVIKKQGLQNLEGPLC